MILLSFLFRIDCESCVCAYVFFFVCSFSYYILFCRHRNRRLPYTILHNKFSEENRRKEKGIERSTISWMIIMIQSLIRQFSHFDSCYISFYRFATKFIIASLCISFSFHFISLVMFGLLLIIFKHASDTNPQQQKPLTIQNKFTLWKISLERERRKTRLGIQRVRTLPKENLKSVSFYSMKNYEKNKLFFPFIAKRALEMLRLFSS